MGSPRPGVGIAPMRAWRVKAKGKCVAAVAFDFDGDGGDGVVALWAGGKVEVRRAGSGELLFRDQLEGTGAGLAVSPYKGDGKPLLLILSTEGECKAYGQVDPVTLLAYRTAAGILGTGVVDPLIPPTTATAVEAPTPTSTTNIINPTIKPTSPS